MLPLNDSNSDEKVHAARIYFGAALSGCMSRWNGIEKRKHVEILEVEDGEGTQTLFFL